MKHRYLIRSTLSLAMGLAVTLVLQPPVQAADSLLFGEQQAYSAIVRPDGKVITYAKIYLNNQTNDQLKTTSFTIPKGVEATDLSAYQVLLPERCATTSDTSTNASSINTPDTSYYRPYDTCDSIKQNIYTMDKYGYGYYSSVSDALRYAPIEASAKDGTYTLTLPTPIEPNERGAYLVAYAVTKGYVTNTAGVYTLQFKTLAVAQNVERVRVSVDVASDFYTKVRRSSISPSSSDLSITGGADSAKNESFSNAGLDKLQSSIGSGGTFVKTGQGLLPGESLVVNGEFADAQWKLYWKELFGTIAGFIVLTALALFLINRADRDRTVTPKKGKSHGKK